MRSVLLALLLPSVAALMLVPASPGAACSHGVRSSPISMAHHVQKKATSKHEANRPRKSRPSDINRRPPSYPAIPDGPWYTISESAPSVSKQVIEIAVSPTDDAAALSAKLVSAGAAAPEAFEYAGSPLTGTLADCGLEAETTLEATVVTKP